MELIMIFISAAIVNNFVLSKFLGICPFLGVSKKIDSAVGMGIAVTYVMTMSSILTYIIYNFILLPLNMKYMYTIVFILVIASFVQILEIVLAKVSKKMYNSLGIYLPLITTNCAVLGVVVINMNKNYNFIESIANTIGAGVGFTIAILIMATIREKIEYNDIPKFLKGIPIVLVAASFIAMAFIGFSGINIQ